MMWLLSVHSKPMRKNEETETEAKWLLILATTELGLAPGRLVPATTFIQDSCLFLYCIGSERGAVPGLSGRLQITNQVALTLRPRKTLLGWETPASQQGGQRRRKLPSYFLSLAPFHPKNNVKSMEEMTRQICKQEQAFQLCLSALDARHGSIISPSQPEMSRTTTASEMRRDVGLSFRILFIVEVLINPRENSQK